MDNYVEGLLLPQWLKDIPELDLESGVTNCGDEERYLSILEVFHEMAETKADQIERYEAEGDIANYTVEVHALKSSARIIGAGALSEMAKELEAAGKAGDLEMIRRETGNLLARYRSLDRQLRAFDEKAEELREFTDEMRREALLTLIEMAGTMDYGLVEDILHELKGYQISSSDEELLRQVEKKLLGLDWDGIRELVQAAL